MQDQARFSTSVRVLRTQSPPSARAFCLFNQHEQGKLEKPCPTVCPKYLAESLRVTFRNHVHRSSPLSVVCKMPLYRVGLQRAGDPDLWVYMVQMHRHENRLTPDRLFARLPTRSRITNNPCASNFRDGDTIHQYHGTSPCYYSTNSRSSSSSSKSRLRTSDTSERPLKDIKRHATWPDELTQPISMTADTERGQYQASRSRSLSYPRPSSLPNLPLPLAHLPPVHSGKSLRRLGWSSRSPAPRQSPLPVDLCSSTKLRASTSHVGSQAPKADKLCCSDPWIWVWTRSCSP